jgi:hypothetical protein
VRLEQAGDLGNDLAAPLLQLQVGLVGDEVLEVTDA